jgi:hypothetical protein
MKYQFCLTLLELDSVGLWLFQGRLQIYSTMSSGNENERPDEVMDDGVFRRPLPPKKKLRRQFTTTGPEIEDAYDEELEILMEVLDADEDENGLTEEDESWIGWYPLPWIKDKAINKQLEFQGTAHQIKLLIKWSSKIAQT